MSQTSPSVSSRVDRINSREPSLSERIRLTLDRSHPDNFARTLTTYRDPCCHGLTSPRTMNRFARRLELYPGRSLSRQKWFFLRTNNAISNT